MAKTVELSKHILVPKHTKLNEKDKDKLLQELNISVSQLPKILRDDPAIKGMKLREGDVVKITRKSPTVGESVFYRGVTNG